MCSICQHRANKNVFNCRLTPAAPILLRGLPGSIDRGTSSWPDCLHDRRWRRPPSSSTGRHSSGRYEVWCASNYSSVDRSFAVAAPVRGTISHSHFAGSSLMTASRETWRHAYITLLSFLNISVTVLFFNLPGALVVPLGHLRRLILTFIDWLIDWLVTIIKWVYVELYVTVATGSSNCSRHCWYAAQEIDPRWWEHRIYYLSDIGFLWQHVLITVRIVWGQIRSAMHVTKQNFFQTAVIVNVRHRFFSKYRLYSKFEHNNNYYCPEFCYDKVDYTAFTRHYKIN